jgi:hypothetical protein
MCEIKTQSRHAIGNGKSLRKHMYSAPRVFPAANLLRKERGRIESIIAKLGPVNEVLGL